MAKEVVQNRFDGGIAEDVRTTATNECEYSVNFDVFTNPHKLIHHQDQIEDTSSFVSECELSDVGMTTIAGNTYMVAFGHVSSVDARPAAYIRPAYDFNGTSAWAQQAVGVTGYTFIKNTYVQYGGVSFILSKNGTTYNLQKYIGAGSLVSVGTFVAEAGVVVPKPYMHPDDKILYMVIGSTIASYNIATNSLLTYSNILPKGYFATCVSHFGGYLQIGLVPEITGDSLMVSWGRDGSLNTLQGSVNMGSLYLQTIQNIEGSVIAISRTTNVGEYRDKVLEVKGYSGGDYYKLIKNIPISLNIANYNIVSFRKDECIYFAIAGDIAIYRVGKNKSGRWVVAQDRLLASGSPADVITNLTFVGDYMFVSYLRDGAYRLSATNTSPFGNLNTAIYRQTINNKMPDGDKADEKKILYIEAILESPRNLRESVLKYIVDGVTGTVAIKTNEINKNMVLKGKAEHNGKPFLQGRDIQLQIETTAGTNVKSLRYVYQPINLI